MKRALVCGAGGQDGSYLAELLVGKGYHVVGTGRGATPPPHLDRLAGSANFRYEPLDIASQATVHSLVERVAPHEIYALAGQSSVGESFVDPAGTLSSIVMGVLNLLEVIRRVDPAIRLYHAGSSETFGDLGGARASEQTPMHPRSPYGVAKASAQMLVRNYRESYGLFAANGILFNHESPRRPHQFVTRKITAAALRIAQGSGETLHLGRLDIVRDWGWAPEYVEAMWRIVQSDVAEDFVIATGISVSLADFVESVFASFDLDWRAHVTTNEALMRPSDLDWSGADPSRAFSRLSWRAETTMPDVARLMALAEREQAASGQFTKSQEDGALR